MSAPKNGLVALSPINFPCTLEMVGKVAVSRRVGGTKPALRASRSEYPSLKLWLCVLGSHLCHQYNGFFIHLSVVKPAQYGTK